MLRLVLHLTVLTVLVGGLLGVAYRMEKVRPKHELQEYLYLPKSPELRKFAFGFEGVYSDFLWILSLQGFYKHCLEKIPFKNIREVYETITDLDPHFQEAYNTGSIYCAIVHKSSLAGIKLLETGTKKVPDQPWIWELLGRMYWLERHNLEKRGEMTKSEATALAIKAVAKSVELGAGEDTRILLQFLGLYDKFATLDIVTWLDIYAKAGRNTMLKQLALPRIQTHIAQLHIKFIQEELQKFRQTNQRWPKDLDELKKEHPIPLEPHEEDMEGIATGLLELLQSKAFATSDIREAVQHYVLSQLPLNKPPREYLYDAQTGEVLSDHMETNRCWDMVSLVQRMVDRFNLLKGRFPHTLEELVTEHVMQRIPQLPLGKSLSYDANQGTVGLREK